MADQYVLLCEVAPVAGECPTGSEAWVSAQVLSGVHELSRPEIDVLLSAILTMVAVAVGIRFLIKQFVK